MTTGTTLTPAEGLSAVTPRKIPSAEALSMLMEAARRREQFIWKMLKREDPSSFAHLPLATARATRRRIREAMEEAAIRIFQFERPEVAGDWSVWVRYWQQFEAEHAPHQGSENGVA